jgi:hypothetical protein
MNQNVTLIDNLPDIDSLDTTPYGSSITQQGHENHSILSPEQSQKYDKYIRKTNTGHSMYQQTQDQEQEFRNPYIPEQKEAFNMPTNTPSCLEVAEHILFCPICSRFYNNDKTVYIIAIIVLSLICCLLLKRVLDV